MRPARILPWPARSRPFLSVVATDNPSDMQPDGATRALNASPEDQALLARMADRDAGAFALLYDRHAAVAFGMAVHLLGDSTAAERAVEEAFLTIWRQAPSPDGMAIVVSTRLLELVCRYARATGA